MPEKSDPSGPEENPVEQQAREQTGQRRVRVRVDEREMQTTYANAFHTRPTNDEVMLGFGLNVVVPSPEDRTQPEILFKVNQQVILNYYTAKRLAINLSQVIRRHEEQFGELELDVAKRRKDSV